jgi:hypothetical protein
MSGIVLKNKTIDKYFRFLKNLDNPSKKRMIIKLTESIEVNKRPSKRIETLFGAWEDNRDSDEIIREIRESRTKNRDIEDL